MFIFLFIKFLLSSENIIMSYSSFTVNRRELIGVVRRRIDDHLTEEVPAGAAVDAFFASKAALFQTVPLCEREVDVVVGAPDHLRLGRVDRADGEEAEVGQLRLEAVLDGLQRLQHANVVSGNVQEAAGLPMGIIVYYIVITTTIIKIFRVSGGQRY